MRPKAATVLFLHFVFRFFARRAKKRKTDTTLWQVKRRLSVATDAITASLWLYRQARHPFCRWSIVAEGVDRIELGGAAGRRDAEE
jgi:hypothetical protein